jgi:hypothetical protein
MNKNKTVTRYECPPSETVSVQKKDAIFVGPSAKWLAAFERSIAGKRVRRIGPLTYLVW